MSALGEPRSALVTGASGFIGRPLVARLLASGWRVAALTRQAEPGCPPGVRIHIGDLSTGAGLSGDLVDDVDVVFHCAGEVRDRAAMRRVHVDGTRALLQCLPLRSERPPVHWLQLSSVGAYGPPSKDSRSRRVDENTPEHPVGEYEITKTESDRLVIQAASQGRLSYTILRPANVIGAQMPNASLAGLLAMVRRGLFFHIGPPRAIATFVHVDDVVSALMACALKPEAQRQVFNLSSDCPLEAVIDHAARAMGVPPPRLRVPERLVRGVVAVCEQVALGPLTTARVDALVNRTAYPSTKIESTLGFRFSRPMPAAIEDLVGGPRRSVDAS